MRARPLQVERGLVFKDVRCVRKETSVPQVGAAAFKDVEIISLQVKAQRASCFILTVNDDNIIGLQYGRDDIGELL